MSEAVYHAKQRANDAWNKLSELKRRRRTDPDEVSEADVKRARREWAQRLGEENAARQASAS